jgi:hypothetical protein
MDQVENTVSNSTSIVSCVSVAVGTCLPSRCLETALHATIFTEMQVLSSVVCLLTDINYCRRNCGLTLRMLSSTPIILSVILGTSGYHVTVIINCFLCLLMYL